MSFDASAITSPLALIALFVAIIELFLIYPIAKLEGKDRTRLVLFVIGYPIFIAFAFFVFLWNKPINLYEPQTLSSELQKALLPESLNRELAPERATIAAIEIKLTQLEASLASVSRETREIAGKVSAERVLDLAKKSDIEQLRTELLTRAAKTGDLSRENLASVAKAIKTETEQQLKARTAAAESELSKFRQWMIQKGLQNAPDVPKVADEVSEIGPSVGEDSIELGPENVDYVVPATYFYYVARDRGYRIRGHNSALLWTLVDYLAARYGGKRFPVNPNAYGIGNHENMQSVLNTISKKGFVGSYSEFFRLIESLVSEVGDTSVEAGLIYLANNWNKDTDFGASLALISEGMAKNGASMEKVRQVFEAFELSPYYEIQLRQ